MPHIELRDRSSDYLYDGRASVSRCGYHGTSVHIVHSDGQESTLVVLIDPMLVAILVLANAICVSVCYSCFG